MSARRILIVDDDKDLLSLLKVSLARRDFEIVTASTAEEGLAALAESRFSAVVTDLNMPNTNGIELCSRVVQNRPDTPVIVITAFGNLDTAISAIRVGAYDFLTKPFEIDALALALERALSHFSLREEVKVLRRAQESRSGRELLGESPAIERARSLIGDAARSESNVLLTGETGTGKEIAARSIHEQSTRRAGPFVAINCAAMPETMLESELFGHVKGAFTDARQARTGLVVQAQGGTLFLDEIGDMPLTLQPKLLRVLQERTVRALGADEEVPVDVRVICATHRDLESAIEDKTFRGDLFFRINVFHIDLPPLRARSGDVLLLAQHFLEHFAARAKKQVEGLSPAAAKKLLAYEWPGNIRELQNCIERAVAVARTSVLTPDDLPEKVSSYTRSHVLIAADDPSELVPMDEVERRYVLRVLEAVGGNKSMAASVLGFDRKTLYRKLASYGVK
ncbi:MAG: sigma-54-dependent Fis family transcriptional regulator [Archangium sp.]|nr:sigma-54-dependent Fis family transcriptional regulator [Archangium sp.]